MIPSNYMKVIRSRRKSYIDEIMISNCKGVLILVYFADQRMESFYGITIADYEKKDGLLLRDRVMRPEKQWRIPEDPNAECGLTHANAQMTLCAVKRENRRRAIITAPQAKFPSGKSGLKTEFLITNVHLEKNKPSLMEISDGYISIDGERSDFENFKVIYVPRRYEIKKDEKRETFLIFSDDKLVYLEKEGKLWRDPDGLLYSFEKKKDHYTITGKNTKLKAILSWKETLRIGGLTHERKYISLSGRINNLEMKRGYGIYYKLDTSCTEENISITYHGLTNRS